MFGMILNSPLESVTTCGKSHVSDIWQGFEFTFAVINDFRKKIHLSNLTEY